MLFIVFRIAILCRIVLTTNGTANAQTVMLCSTESMTLRFICDQANAKQTKRTFLLL